MRSGQLPGRIRMSFKCRYTAVASGPGAPALPAAADSNYDLVGNNTPVLFVRDP